jgi:hypothetical protein
MPAVRANSFKWLPAYPPAPKRSEAERAAAEVAGAKWVTMSEPLTWVAMPQPLTADETRVSEPLTWVAMPQPLTADETRAAAAAKRLKLVPSPHGRGGHVPQPLTADKIKKTKWQNVVM